MKIFLPIALIFFSQAPCVDGFSGKYPCNQITLLAHMEPSELEAVEHNSFWLNDIWGWTDPETDKEYALVGLKDGVAFVDVSTPTNPVFLGKLPEPNTANNRNSRTSEVQHGKSTWRDIKTYKNYALIVSDLNAAHGMQIFDLTKLRDINSPQTFEQDAHYQGFGSAHNIVINEDTGHAFAVGISSGGTTCSGGLHIIDINEPLNPTFIGCFSEDNYTHDAQCVTYYGTDTDYQDKAVCFNSNENTLTIVNLEDPENPEMISRTGYDNARYSHQGWLTEDHRFFLMNDELDEDQFGHNAKTLIWDIEDLDNPLLIGSYYNNEPSIDHNLYTRDDMVFESNYWSGLRVLSSENIQSGELREIASFDTYPEGDGIHFGGTWSNYPYFSSGTIIVSDMNNGLFILKLDLSEDPIIQMPVSLNECSGNGYEFTMESTDGLDLQWQSFNGFTYSDLIDNELVSGATTNTLNIIPDGSLDDLQFRCKLTDQQGSVYYTYLVEYDGDSYPPISEFTVQTDDTGFASFTNTSSEAESYLWDFGDGNTSAEANPQHQYEFGVYDVTLTAYNACGSSEFTNKTHIVTGLDEQSKELRMYPNPASRYVNIYTEEACNLSIYTLTGELITTIEKQSGIQYFPVSNLSSGSYIVTITTSSGSVSKVLMKQ
ncbi:MAG: hypothetical protein CMP48_10795 [Rickettsiales bacterium]|nr:hypothetical protein [Rickettsiales bacterium]